MCAHLQTLKNQVNESINMRLEYSLTYYTYVILVGYVRKEPHYFTIVYILGTLGGVNTWKREEDRSSSGGSNL